MTQPTLFVDSPYGNSLKCEGKGISSWGYGGSGEPLCRQAADRLFYSSIIFIVVAIVFVVASFVIGQSSKNQD